MSAPAPIEPAAFRRAMSRWATGVSVVTTRDGDRDLGLTVNSFLSASLHPPSVLVSIGDESNSAPVIHRTGRFAVSVLRADQADVSARLAQVGQGPAKFAEIPLHRGRTGAALFDGALFALECRVAGELRASDHTLFLGEVVGLEEGPEGLPLLFYHSDYAAAAGPDGLRLPAARR